MSFQNLFTQCSHEKMSQKWFEIMSKLNVTTIRETSQEKMYCFYNLKITKSCWKAKYIIFYVHVGFVLKGVKILYN